MGQKSTNTCNICNYSVLTSGGHDCGMVAVTDTYLCNSCKKIVDVLVGEYGQTYFPKMIFKDGQPESEDSGFYQCPECRSRTDLIPWNTKKRPCPRCIGQMIVNPDGEVIIWD